MDLHVLEAVCRQAYGEGEGGGQQREAQEALLQLEKQPAAADTCIQLLQHSKDRYAQLVAATVLSQIVARISHGVPVAQRLQLRALVLDMLYSRSLEPYVAAELCRLLARLTKSGWYDLSGGLYAFRSVAQEVEAFLSSAAPAHVALGFQLLDQVVQEMSQPNPAQGSAKHRQLAASFRDESLYNIFRLAIEMVTKAVHGDMLTAENETVLYWVLNLVYSCLDFDFIGTYCDDGSDDLRSVQIPTSWQATVDGSLLDTFFDLYLRLQSILSTMCLRCIVLLASVHRICFKEPQRLAYLTRLLNGVHRLLQSEHGFKDINNYHEFCRLLAQIKTNYQLMELVQVPNYNEIMTSITNFSVFSLENSYLAPNSVHYVLDLWDRFIRFLAHTKGTDHNMKHFSPQITKAFVTSRLNTVSLMVDEKVPNVFEDASTLETQLKQIGTIGRSQYATTFDIVVAHFDPLAEAYIQHLLHGPLPNTREIKILEGQLTWLVYIISSVTTQSSITPSLTNNQYPGTYTSFNGIGNGYKPSPLVDDPGDLDGPLLCRCLQLVRILMEQMCTNRRYCGEHLEMAVLKFIQTIQKNYLLDDAPKSPKVQLWLDRQLGLADDNMLLNVLVQKILTNLQFWDTNDNIVTESLALFIELTRPMVLAKKLSKIQSLTFLLSNHSSEAFSFLDRMNDSKHRTTFYTALTRIVIYGLTHVAMALEEFLAPIGGALDALANQFAMQKNPADERAKFALLALVRTLRGICSACDTKDAYLIFFDWLNATRLAALRTGLELWADDPAIAVPVLKFYAEFAHKRNARIVFGISSPNGILLFREISRVLTCYGQRLLSLPPDSISNKYAQRYKGISVCCTMLKHTLDGEYVNFGVFELYGDRALDDALTIFIKMTLSVELSDLTIYPKLMRAYFDVCKKIIKDHAAYLLKAGPQVFEYVLLTLAAGIESLVSTLCMIACESMDSLLTFIFKHVTRAKAGRESLLIAEMVKQCSPVLLQIMISIFRLLVFEDTKPRYGLSRPLLVLMLLNPSHFEVAKNHILEALPEVDRELVSAAINKLADVEFSLTDMNRNSFTKRIHDFRKDIGGGSSGSGSASTYMVDITAAHSMVDYGF